MTIGYIYFFITDPDIATLGIIAPAGLYMTYEWAYMIIRSFIYAMDVETFD